MTLVLKSSSSSTSSTSTILEMGLKLEILESGSPVSFPMMEIEVLVVQLDSISATET